MARTLGGMVKKKNIQLHIFLAQAKRHGLVVVSGMALGEFMGNTEGYIVWISITQKYFQLFSGSWNETIQVPADAS